MDNAIGSDYKETLSNVLPSDAFELAIRDAKTFFMKKLYYENRTHNNQTKKLINKDILHIRVEKRN